MAMQMSKQTRVRKPKKTKTPAGEPRGGSLLSPEDRARRIAVAAYYKAKQRGFAQGRELEDWLDAEKEIDALSEIETVDANTSGRSH